MSSIPHLWDREGQRAMARDLAAQTRVAMKKKHGAQWGEKPVPWHQRVGAPMKSHDDEPVWYDLKKYPMGSTIQSEAPDILSMGSGSRPPGVTTTRPVLDRDGEPVYRIRRTRHRVGKFVERDGSGQIEYTTVVREERIPKMVEICCHSRKPVGRCCPWILARRKQNKARDKKTQAAERRAAKRDRAEGRRLDMQPTTYAAVRGDTITTGRQPQCTGIDPYGRTIVGTPGQLRAEARRHGKYLSAGPGAE